jgi:hypothetical protein
MTQRPRLWLYGTRHCHLCEQAEALVAPIAAAFGWLLEEPDVTEDDTLFEIYGERVPVLARSDRREELGWPFDTRMVQDYLMAPGDR